ncbi:MAG: dienelactone hydrolase family protein [Deltaproteobacteria bacterium]|nr:dienelactone hydrolase family protein [Deltaproteobacteria bacterium]
MEAVAVDHVEVRRTAVLAHTGPVGAPNGWMVLHGIHQRAADFIAPWTRIEGQAGRRVLAPEGLSRTILDFEKDTAGACWTTIPDRPIDLPDAYAWLDACAERLDREAGDGARVLLGFSQGSIIAARWAVARERLWDAVVIWGGGIPRDVDPRLLASRSKDGAIHLAIGERDSFATAERRDAMRAALQAAGVTVRLRTFAGGHRLDDATIAALATELET